MLNLTKEDNKKWTKGQNRLKFFHICRAKSFLLKLSAKWNEKKSFLVTTKKLFRILREFRESPFLFNVFAARDFLTLQIT